MLPSLAIDLDGVVVSFMDALLTDYNNLPEVQAKSAQLKLEQVNYEFELMGEEIAARLRSIFNAPGFFLKLDPLPNALNLLTRFRDMGFPGIICTSPARDCNNLINGRTAWEKYDWVQRHLPVWGNDVMITRDKFYVGTDMLIDDYPPNIIQWCEYNPDGVGYLIDQPWNNKFTHYPINSIRGPLEGVLSFVDKFWCKQRKKFVYRLEELQLWAV
jgi:5'(3')-deoxyribonucleotidase